MCEIQWAMDASNQPSPCNKPHIGWVRYRRHVQQIAGRGVWVGDDIKRYAICSMHARLLHEPGMEQWEFEPREYP